MGRKSREKQENNITVQSEEKPTEERVKFKKAIKILSWSAGSALISIVFLPNFEYAFIDILVKVMYLFGISTMLIVIVLEFFENKIVEFMEKKS